MRQEKDVIPLSARRFIVQLWNLDDIPAGVSFDHNYEGKIVVAIDGDKRIACDCVIHRPSNRRNVLGARADDWLLIDLETDLDVEDLKAATISVSHYGRDLGVATARESR